MPRVPMKFTWLALPAALALAACGSDDDVLPELNTKPSYLGTITTTSYDGTSDDLLTAGLGWDGLQSATAPALSNPPTATELRRRAIYNNYRALVDMSSAGGYGSLYGPNVSLAGAAITTPGAGKIAGTEYLAYSDDGSGRRNVTLMVQIPANFDANQPCIVTATSSGSRGVYGAVSAAGEWGLKRGCAVAYSDKGTGNGAHELGSGTVTLQNGLTATAAAAGNASHFTANVGATDLAAFNIANPSRYAYKHAHSQQNPEKDWGLFTLQAVEFAFFAINDRFGTPVVGGKARSYRPENTLVIAASVSNGGGASLAAAEQDTRGLIDAVVVGEPQVNLRLPTGLRVQRGGADVAAFGKPLYDYTTLANLLQPCAAHAPGNAASPLLATVPVAGATARCAALAAAGLVTGATFAEQAADALARLNAAGWEADSNLLHASHWGLQATPGVAVTYAKAYGRASVTENLCGFSFATTNTAGQPAAAAASPMASVFGNGNGVPPTNGINLVYNNASGGAVLHTLANGEFAFAGAQCLRAAWTATPASGSLAARVQGGVDEVRLTGNLRGKPALIVQGRNDTLVPVNHTSRPYLGMNKLAEGAASKLSYIEVTNAQHFDTFLSLAGFNERYVPLHYYNIQALNLMWSHLRSGTALPPSQVVRTTPRGAGAPPISVATHLPAISTSPAAGDAITFSNNTVNVPN